MAEANPPDLESLYDEHAPALFAFLLNLTRHEADTRDLLQEIFVKIARRPGLMAGVREPRAFLLRLAHNAAVDLMRRAGTRHQHATRQRDDESHFFAATPDPDETTFRRAISESLRHLPPEQRAVVHLKLWENLTFEDIAGTLDIPVNTAASRYRYGLDKLRALLRPLYEEIKS